MIQLIPDVLTEAELDQLKRAYDAMSFVSGKSTTGKTSQRLKHNLQRERRDEHADQWDRLIVHALERNPLFAAAAIPRRFRPPVFCRYETGMHYGAHVDAALMGTQDSPMRTDLSVTVFLNNPEDYDGGELIIQTDIADEEIKLPAGSAVVYPTTYLHSVEAVTRGRRDVAVSWVQSFVREPSDRQLLYELSRVSAQLNDTAPDTEGAQLANKVYTNLLRKLAEV